MQTALPVCKYFGRVKVLVFVRKIVFGQIMVQFFVCPKIEWTCLQDTIGIEVKDVQRIAECCLAMSQVGEPHIGLIGTHRPAEGF